MRGWWEIIYKKMVGTAKIATRPGQLVAMTSMGSHSAKAHRDQNKLGSAKELLQLWGQRIPYL